VGIDGSKAGVPTFARHGKIEVRSLWGELAYQLGGEQAWKVIKDSDTPEAQPNEHEFEKLVPNGPVLILLDELVVYRAGLSERGQGNILGFLKKLASIVGKHPQAVLVVSDPAGQAAYAKQAAQLGKALDAEPKLDEVLARQMSDFNPVAGEAAQVIVRRLLEHVDSAAAQAASATYHALYERVLQEMPAALPARVGGAEYARRVVQCYPFHSRLIDTATDRLGAMQDFQKSRRVLRLFARILRDVWESGEDVELISAGELDWASPRIQADFLQRLNRDDFRAAVSADVDTHAGELDGDRPRGIHRRVASAILLESLPLQPSSGLEPSEVTLAILRPDEAGPEPVEAAQRLAGVCWHLSLEDARSRVLGEAQGYFSGPTFKLRAWPTGPR
jgi:predicted AAA+ superfamily ATPase